MKLLVARLIAPAAGVLALALVAESTPARAMTDAPVSSVVTLPAPAAAEAVPVIKTGGFRVRRGFGLRQRAFRRGFRQGFRAGQAQAFRRSFGHSRYGYRKPAFGFRPRARFAHPRSRVIIGVPGPFIGGTVIIK